MECHAVQVYIFSLIQEVPGSNFDHKTGYPNNTLIP
jgi:hypothetical protein